MTEKEELKHAFLVLPLRKRSKQVFLELHCIEEVSCGSVLLKCEFSPHFTANVRNSVEIRESQ